MVDKLIVAQTSEGPVTRRLRDMGDGTFADVVHLGARLPGSRASTVSVLLLPDDFTRPGLDLYNDGLGTAVRDNEVRFNGLPTIRLDPQGNITAGTTPGATVDLAGVVCKRRMGQLMTLGKLGWEGWVRFTSGNNSAGGAINTSWSIYNRDGTNMVKSTIWIDTNTTSNAILVKYLNSGGTYTQVGSNYPSSHAQHQYDPPNGQWDLAGIWYYVKLIVDFPTGKYVSFQLNETLFDLTNIAMYTVASAGARGVHFSMEYAARNSTRRFINIAQPVATIEP